MSAHTTIPRRIGLAAPRAAPKTTTPLLQSWCVFRLRRDRERHNHARAASERNPPSNPGWQAAEWAPAQPAIVFGGGGAASPSAPSAPSSPPAAAPTATTFRLAVYTKPGCPLCDNLADRAQAVLDRAAFLPGGGALGRAGVDVRAGVERRDVSLEGREEWARLHAGEVPVLVMLRSRGDGGGKEDEEEEVPVARPPPRVTADKLERHLAAAATEASLAGAAAASGDANQH
jgi:hypothetical protein